MCRLLAGQKVSLKGFTSKRGNKFDATLVIDKDKDIVFDFGDNKERKRNDRNTADHDRIHLRDREGDVIGD